MTLTQEPLESRRILCIRLRNWPIDRVCRRRRELRLNPLALIQTTANRRFVAAACGLARSLGVGSGIDQAEAMAVCPSLVCIPHDPVADARGLCSLGRWMMRFTPVVSVANGPEDPLGTPDALMLDVTGCERVFHGLDNLVRRVEKSIERFRLDARLAVGPNPGAAWAMTYSLSPVHGGEGWGEGRVAREYHPSPRPSPPITGERESLLATLSDIPCEALRIDDDTVAKLYHLGIRTIGQLLQFPRDQLPARFGPLLIRRLDQLLGHTPEPFVPLQPLAVITARMEFDGSVTSLQAVWVVFRELLGRVIAQLARRGCGVRELEVRFDRAYATQLRKTIRLSRPSRDPVNLFNLFRCATEQMDMDAKDGFIGMRVLVRVHEPLPDEQVGLLDGENYAGEVELDRLIERLCARLGEHAIAQAEPVESYIPERSYRTRPVMLPELCRGELCVRPMPTSRRHTRAKTSFAPTNCRTRSAHEARQASQLQPLTVRPLHLLPKPLEVPVTVNPYNDQFGQPMQFLAGHDRVHRLVHVLGPERISGQWWDGHNKTRDYFDVEDETGRRFWIFRVNETRLWYLHGQFA